MKQWIFILLVLISQTILAQEKKDEPKFGISFSGFVKNDFFLDTRESYTIREGHFLLYPKEVSKDADGNDINDKSSFNFLSLQSRITGKITAPDAFGAKTSAVLEADFFGNENASFVDANGFRLRHAFVKLNWAKTELLTGQYWHPFFIPGCFSGVISFNTGAPMQPFSRNPQIRLTHKLGKISLAAAVSAQRDFTSPQGPSSLRYSTLPDLGAIVSYESNNTEKKSGMLAGVAVGYKILQPLLTTTKGVNTYITSEKISGFSATAFARYKNPAFTLKLQGIYGQNLFDLTMLGGYAVHSVTDTMRNTVDYTALKNLTGWAEFNTNGEKFQFGLWAGYTQNLGADDSILVYSNKAGGTDATVRGANVKSILRVSPRIIFISGKFNFATELEYTNAAYATRDANGLLNRDEKGVITESEGVSNIRILLSVIYNF
ncbi:MAG: outer membrane protein [Bacteroidetes bacterium]|nr:MAG: outer membrane protein [Bacteroidota bacterium]